MSAKHNILMTTLLLTLGSTGCGKHEPGGMSGPTINNKMSSPEQTSSVQSTDIMKREPVANRARVRHILIGWADLASSYNGRIDPRAKARSQSEAEELVKELYTRLEKGEPFEALMSEYSEDQSSASSGLPIDVAPDAPLVLDFRRLSLRLEVGEIGIVETSFGLHIIKRVS